MRHGVCLTVTVVSVVRLWETGPKVGEGGEKAEGQAEWSAQPYLPVNTCGNHVHTCGHRRRGGLHVTCHLSLSSNACTVQVPSHGHRSLHGCASVFQGSSSPAPLSIYLSNSHMIGPLSTHGLSVVLRAIPPSSIWPLGFRPMVQLAPALPTLLYPSFP